MLVITAAHQDAPREEMRDGYRVVRLPGWHLPKTRLGMNYDIPLVASPRNWSRLKALLAAHRPEVIHQHGQFFDLTWMTSIWARRHGAPVVLTVHTPLIHTSKLYGFVLRVADFILVRPFIALSRPTVVVFDKWMRRYVKARYGVPDRRLAPIVVGIDPTRFDGADGSVVRSDLRIGSDPLILSLGHVIPLRNRLTLVRALPELLERYPTARVVVVGEVYDTAFLELAEELGVRESILAIGALARTKVPDIVAAADMETHDHQGFGLGTTTLEVMATGRPVIAAADTDNFPGLELRSWENIVLIGTEDYHALARAMVRLLDEPELATRIAKAEREFIRTDFAISAVARKHLELYEQVA